MKATEWADRFNAEKDVFKIILEFAGEAAKLIYERTKTSDGVDFIKAATEGALREARTKWLAVQRRSPRLQPFNFDQIVKHIRLMVPSKAEKWVA